MIKLVEGKGGWTDRYSPFFMQRINSYNQRYLSLSVLAIISSYHLSIAYLTLNVCIEYILYTTTIHRYINIYIIDPAKTDLFIINP